MVREEKKRKKEKRRRVLPRLGETVFCPRQPQPVGIYNNKVAQTYLIVHNLLLIHALMKSRWHQIMPESKLECCQCLWANSRLLCLKSIPHDWVGLLRETLQLVWWWLYLTN